jgi:MFS family permease
MVWAGSAGTAVVLLLFALAPWPPLAIAASVVAGVSWIMVLSTFNVAAQSVLPDWVRGRGLSIYGLVFYAAMTVGSLTWGALASVAGIVPALLLAAAGMAAGVLLTRHVTLTSDRPDQSPASLWPEPPVAVPVPGERGPVRVTVEYIVDAADKAAFLEALRPVEAERRRNGAYAWAVYEDAARPSVMLETFEEPSWSDHLRHHTRLTKADVSLHEAVRRFHRGTEPPVVTHWLSGEV